MKSSVLKFFKSFALISLLGLTGLGEAATPPTLSLSHSPGSPGVGQGFSISWSATNASSTKSKVLYCYSNDGGFSDTRLMSGTSGTFSYPGNAAWAGKTTSCALYAYYTDDVNAAGTYETFTFAAGAPALTPPALNFGACSSGTTTAPTAATASCSLSNSGQTAASSISYSGPGGTTVSGPSSCAANSSCGTVTVRTGTSAGSYSGSVSASPNTGSAGSTSVSLTVNAPVVVTPAPTISVWRSMSPLVAGQSYTTSWATTNATSLSFNCTASGTGFAGSAPITPLSGTAAPYVAPAGWVGYPTTCVWTATGPGGTAQITEGFTTVAGVTPAALSLSNCSNNSGTTSPTPASMSCTLSNTGGTGVGSISYASLADMSVSGPTGSCAASSTCGQVTVTTAGAAKAYSGSLTATANTGASTSQTINLQVVAPPPPAALSISGCSSVSPTTVPTAASMRCTVSNAGGTAVSSISYAGLTGMNVSGPIGYCAAYATCGDLNISTGTSTKIYSGTLTATPNSGSAAAVAVNLQVLGNTVLQLQDCRTQSPAVSPNAAVMQCMLVNTGYDMVTGIQYSALSGMSVTGPTKYCDGGEECGTVTITTNGDPGSYSGILTVTPTPYTGTKPSISINLRVNQAPAELVLSNCSVNSPAAEPTPATRQCTLTNNGGPAASISYSATGGLIAPTSPSSCAGNGTVCGTVIVQTPTTAGQYDGTLTVTPNNGTGQTMPVSLTVQKSPPTGTLSSSEANNAQLKAGHNITFSWTLQNATEATLGCTDGSTSYDRAPINVNSGSRVITVRDEWMGKNIGCSVLATGSGGSFISNMLFFDVPRKPAILKVFRTPLIPIVGESYTTTWETTDATNMSFSCTANGTGFAGSATMTPPSGTAPPNIALAAWADYPSTCVWTAIGPGGVATYPDTFQVKHAAARLEMSNCEVTSPTTEPTPASRQCKLTNYGGPTSLITYVATGRLIAPATPSSCAGYGADCGTVIVKTPTDAGEYEGALTVTPNNGTGQSMPVSLLKVQKNPPTGSLTSSLQQNAKVNVGQTFTLTWTLQNATTATLGCNSDWLFDVERSPVDLTGGSRVVTVKSEWLNKTVGCALAAENSGGKLNPPMLFIEVVAAQPTITVSQSPTPLIAGQPYTTTWTTSHAKNVSFSCKANGTGFVMDAPVDNVNGTSPENIAQGAWVGNPSTCIWTATGDGGSATYTQTMETIYPPTTLSLSNCRHNMPVMEPSAATYTCDLKNAGAAISGISHNVTGGMQAEGNPSCAAMSDCGTVVVKTPAVGGSYSGRLSVAYGAGKLVTEDVNLTVSSNRATATLLKISPAGSTLNVGQTFKLSAALSNASQAFVQCTDGAGTANNVGSIPDAGGELDVVVKPEWVDQAIVCMLKARGPVGDIQSEAVTLNVVPPLPTLKVQLISKPDGAPIDGALWVGQNFARKWEVTNAGFVNYYCFAQDTGHNENNAVLHTGVTTSTKGETPTLQAKMEWVGYTSQCVWTAEGKGGTVRWNETIRTEALGMLQLEACELPNPVIYPSKTVLSCQLKNVGKAGVDSIRYETSADLTAEGPTTYCGANSNCGPVKVTMNHFLDNVTGQLSITPNRGAGVSVPLKIHTVFDVALQFGQCTYKNNVMTPGIAEARCPLLNRGFNAAKTIQYQGPSGVEITGPTACANAYTETPTSCGEVLIRTLGPAGNYQGPVTATPDQGYAASFNLDLTVRPLTPEGRVYMSYRAPAIAGEAIPLDWTIYGASTSKNAQLNCSIINDSITVLTQTLTGLSGRAIVPTQAAWANKTVYCEIQAWNLDGASSFVSGQNMKLEPLTQESPILSLANCETKTLTHSPEPASYTCQVRNHGRTLINHIAYEIGTTSMAVTGPSNCAAASLTEAASCGTMKVVTDTVDNTYFGVLKVTPDVGQGVLERLTLVVDPVAYKAMEASIRLGPNNPVAGKSFTVYWNATNASRTKMPHLYCSKREGDLSSQFVSIDLSANSGEVNLATQTDWVGKQGDCGIVFYPENGSDPVMRSAAFTFAQATTHPATITAVADPLPLIVGDKFKIKWATTYASTDPVYPTVYGCTSENGAFTQSANLTGAAGEIELIVDEKWAGKQSNCNFWVHYEDNSNVAIAYLTLDFKALPLQATIDGNFVPAKPEAGKPYTINWSTTNSSTTAMPNLICTSADGGLAEVIGFTTTQGSMSMVAGKDWGGTHSQCRFTAFTQYERPGTGGFKTLDVEFAGQPHPNLVLRNCQVTTKVKSPAQAGIVCDMRNSGAQDATVINYSASNGIQFQNPPASCAANTECGKVSLIASQVGHYQDIITIIANSNVQGAATIQMDLEVLPVDGSGGTTPGTGGGTTTPPVPKLMGEVHGIRSTAEGLLELHGWACLDGSNQALQYSVYSEATSKLGGTLLGTGTANVATENNNTSIANTCHTPGVGHSFVLGLSNYAQSNEGKPLFVEVKEATGSTVLELQCINNNCTMPGTIRIGLTTPQHNDRFAAPGEVFMQALISNTSAPIDEVAFNIGGEWITAQADTQPNTYFAKKSGLAGRTEAYPVAARVKQGSTTLTTTEKLIYVDAFNKDVTISLKAPLNNASLQAGTTTDLSAGVTIAQGSTAQVRAVKFNYNGILIATANDMGNGNWSVKWTPTASGTGKLTATAFDANGLVLNVTTETLVSINAGAASDATPKPVNVDISSYLSLPDAGSLPGNLSVAPSGAATYSIPIDVPPGTAGMQPKLSLDYSSQSQNSRVGLGWNLGGFSSIHRCGKTIAQDGVNGRISFDGDDRLCLDGQRLVLVNGDTTNNTAYWASGAEFRTELESFTKIVATGTVGDANRSYEVRTKDGRISTYGGDNSSTVKAILGTPNSGEKAVAPLPKIGAQSWALNRVEDRVGNFIQYDYDQDAVNGEHRPSAIRYGGKGKASHAKITFDYESRKDAWTRYIDETRNDLRVRLKAITSYVGDNLDVPPTETVKLVRTTTLSYEYSPSSGRSLLQSVEACGRAPSGGVECLPKTTFNWGKPDLSKTPGFVSRGMWSGAPILTTWNRLSDSVLLSANHADYFAFSDFNSDGLTDILEKRIASVVPVGEQNSVQIDLNKSNPIAPGTLSASYRYFHNNGTAFVTYRYQLSTGEDFAVLDIGDYDGNGSPDIWAYTSTGTKICLSPLRQASALTIGSNIIFDCQINAGTDLRNSAFRRPYIVDINGDGRSAHYTTISRDGTAKLCEGANCVVDDAPPEILGLNYSENGLSESPARDYASIVQSIDFSGTGKSSDVRWSEAHFTKYFYDADGTKYTINQYQNLTPTVSFTHFSKPGTNRELGKIFDFKYKAYAPPCANEFCGLPYFFDWPVQGANLTADFNGSGYTSLGFGFIEKGKDANGIFTYQRAENTFCISTGRALDCGIRKKISGNQYKAIRTIGNFVGDGLPSILVEDTKFESGKPPSSGNTVQMCRLTGDDTTNGVDANDTNLVCTPWSAPSVPNLDPVSTGDRWYFMDLLGTGRTQLVYYHSGKYVGTTWEEKGNWEVFEPADMAKPKEALDRIVSVINGLGATSTVEYADGTPSGVVTRSGSSSLMYPLRPTPQLGKIASRLIQSNGVSAPRASYFGYEDAAVDVAGRGSLGFAKFTVTDEQLGSKSITTFLQGYPFTGMVDTVTQVSFGGVNLNYTKHNYNSRCITQANGCTLFVFENDQLSESHDLSGALLGNSTVTNTYGDDWGNLTRQVSMVWGGGRSVTTTNVSTHRNDKTTWLLGLPLTNDITKTDDATPVSSITRRMSRDFDLVTGLMKWEEAESGNQALALKRSFDRTGNNFGLINSVTESWYDPDGQSAKSRVTSTTYDANGRFPTSASNALGHTETSTYDAGTGARLSLTGPNQLTTLWTLNGFGRITKELRADGNETRSYLKACQGSCPFGANVVQVTDSFHGAARITVPQLSFSDNVGHNLGTQTFGFGGGIIYTDKTYDSLGRPRETSQPYFAGQARYLASKVNDYDELGRITSLENYSAGGTAQVTTTEYSGYQTTITNPLLQKRRELRNALQQLTEVTDPIGGKTLFNYDAFGNLIKTTDPSNNVIIVDYDSLGRKTALKDPDLGFIAYKVNPLGQVWSQISPKQRAAGQQTRTVFDELGRMSARYEPDLESHWNYDTAIKGIGQLQEAYTGTTANKTYSRVHVYDHLGRPQETSQSLTDGLYKSSTVYDDWGRVITINNTRSADATKAFEQRYNAYGYLDRLERGALKLWQITKQDAANRVTEAQLGNGLTQTRSYNPYSALIESGAAKTINNEARLQEAYEYDGIGSVTKRSLYWTGIGDGFAEKYSYDNLNRLKTSTIDLSSFPVQTYDYDATGNLLFKTNVSTGNYVYPVQGANSIRPHAVQSIPGIGSFTYDDNGNQTSGAGRSITWKSFDMPDRITKGSEYNEFKYGPEHQRTRQINPTGDIVYAGTQEVETKSGIKTIRTYWPLGIGFEVEEGIKPTQLFWNHTDRLGSIVAQTNQDGQLAQKFAFDSWGHRFTLTGNATPDPRTLGGTLDHRGYTGHEMLDSLDMVHMNGRVYDPLVARFVSADPILQDPMNGQSYNRFAYVLNNPTNLTDPTGFQSVSGSECPKKQQGCVSVYQAPKVAAGAAGQPDVEVQASASGTPTVSTNGDDKKVAKNPGATKSGTAADLHAETWATIGNAAKVAVGNFIPDLVNGSTDWVERFTHTDTGSLGRMSPWVDVRNETAQEAAGDIRKVGGVALMFTPLKGGASAESLAKNVLGNPKMIWGRTAEQIAKDFQAAGFEVVVRQSTRGSGKAVIVEVKGHPEISQVQVHPGGGRHGGAYYKISSTTNGVVKVVDSGYKPTPGEKATIHQGGQ